MDDERSDAAGLEPFFHLLPLSFSLPQQAMGDFAIQFNKNSFGLAPDAPLSMPTLPPEGKHDTSLPLNNLGAVLKMDPLSKLQVAVKNSIDVLYFSTDVPFHILFTEDGALSRSDYLSMWKDLDSVEEHVFTVSGISAGVDAFLNRLEASNVFLVAKRKVESKDLCYMSLKFVNNVIVLLELAAEAGSPVAKVRGVYEGELGRGRGGGAGCSLGFFKSHPFQIPDLLAHAHPRGGAGHRGRAGSGAAVGHGQRRVKPTVDRLCFGFFLAFHFRVVKNYIHVLLLGLDGSVGVCGLKLRA